MTTNVQIVPEKYIHKVWPEVEPYIAAAIEHAHGEDSLDQVKTHVAMGGLQLIVFVDDNNEIKGAGTVRYFNRSNDRVAYCTTLGGKLITDPEGCKGFLDIVRNEGATALEGAGRPSIVRLWRKKLGAREKYSIVEVPL